MHHPIDRIIHTTAFVTPVVEHWLEGEIAQWVYVGYPAMSRQSWEITSPPTGDAGRMKLSYVVPVSLIHI